MHRHVWKVENQVTQPSAWDQVNSTAGRESIIEVEKGPQWAFRHQVIVTYRCEICGSQKVERV